MAARQHGVIAYRQLVALGSGRGAIAHQVANGRLHRVHRGVFAVGHRRLTLQGRRMAAVLAVRDSVLSHRDAAALWGLLAGAGTLFHVTAVARGRAQQRGIKVHQVRKLDARDRTIRDGIPVTSLARTLLDLAEVVPATTLARAYDEAERLRLLDVRALKELCARSPGRRGLKPLKVLIADRTRETPHTKRELEALFFDFCRAHRLPLPACNAMVEGYEVDTLWADKQLVVELDSWEFHGGRRAFERDRERDAVLQAAGYRVVRVTWRRLNEQPEELATLIRRLLS